ncbi:hypothetical protein AB0D08_18240 [Kitasatospora sp. NPDC048540]|uniref:hypothetical protein n=1 Tax=Kitasatospora sp. NPDC048540 TaxID=3155634 RepID=UPI0033C659A2
MNTADDHPPSSPHQLHPCPSCGLTDRLTAVPAVYLAGRDTVTVPDGRDQDGRRTTVTREVTTALSAALAPAPPKPAAAVGCLGVLGVFALLAAVGTFAGGAAGGHWFSDDAASHPRPDPAVWGSLSGTSGGPHHPDLAFLGWISGFALLAAVLLFVAAAGRGAAFRTLTAGRPAAERLWSRAWYCARCGTAHFPPAPGEPSRALGLQEFRSLVWQAGGYGRLVARHPVV